MITSKMTLQIEKELDALKRYKTLIEEELDGEKCHFKLVQHYGLDLPNFLFSKNYNKLFLPILTEIIQELQEQKERSKSKDVDREIGKQKKRKRAEMKKIKHQYD